MKRITQEELEVFLRKHKLWLICDPNGERADLYGADLREADLRGADLRGANLYGADLYGADLRGTDLYGADLRGTDLRGTDLYRANLRGADLRGADLRGTDLYGADLREADLRGANLRGTDLRGTDLYRANLRGADLRGANLYGAKNASIPLACPEEGAFIAFKKAGEGLKKYIVKLLIPEDARRSSATTRKCRCDKAMVLSITNIDGTEAELTSISSTHDSKFIYTVGETVSVDDFDTERFNECAPGIHFFITRQEAVEYY